MRSRVSPRFLVAALAALAFATQAGAAPLPAIGAATEAASSSTGDSDTPTPTRRRLTKKTSKKKLVTKKRRKGTRGAATAAPPTPAPEPGLAPSGVAPAQPSQPAAPPAQTGVGKPGAAMPGVQAPGERAITTPAPAPGPARDVPAPAGPGVAAPGPREAKPRLEPTQPGGQDMGFDLLGESNQPKPEESLKLQSRVEMRRKMLGIHQAFGLGTLTALTATVIVGQLNYMDRFGGGAGSDKYRTPHRLLALTTTAGFATTGILGLLAPVPYDKPHHWDTVATHKLAMGGATLGMLTEVGLGLYTAGREGYVNQRSIAIAHQIIGFTTLGLMLIGAGALLFD